MKTPLRTLTIAEASKLLIEKEISSVELVKSCVEAIETKDADIHAFLSFDAKNAVLQAEAIDKRRHAGESLGPIAGIPCAVKDNILVKGFTATAASKILEPYQAPYDATVIARLRRAGAVFLGKTNLDEFAMGASTENSAFGPTKNPHDFSRVPGGSSGGSAAAVAADECIFALGSDTGGSIRQPASFCGAVGLKPTYGAVSRYGLIAMASSLDQIGPMTKSVEDCATVFETIAGYDPHDATSAVSAMYAELANVVRYGIDGMRLAIGVPKEYFGQGIEKSVETSVKQAIETFRKLGVRIEEISLPHTPYALACYYIVMPAEVSANLARFDGVKYGFSTLRESGRHARALQEVYFETRAKGFGPEARRRIMLGTYVLSAGYYDAYYAKAQKVRRVVQRDFLDAFKKVDLILTPTSPVLPFRFGERTRDPVSMYLADVYTVSINLAGIPALSLPCGFAECQGGAKLPIGLQIIGKHFDEKTILQAAYAYAHANA